MLWAISLSLLLLIGPLHRHVHFAEAQPDALDCASKEIDALQCKTWSEAAGTWQGPIDAGGTEPQYAPTVYFGGLPDDPDDDEVPQPRFVGASNLEDLPKEFDARTKWEQCRWTIGAVWRQGACGSCWAIATASAATDRHCIAGNAPDLQLSPTQLLQCCQHGQNGCEKSDGCSGGHLKESHHYWKDVGLVSGNGEDSPKGCLPYTETIRRGRKTPQSGYCPKQCAPNHGGLVSSQSKYNAKHVGLILPNELQREIFESGPVATRMEAHAELGCCYQSGVYQNATEKPESVHVVKLIGWGNDNGVDYWLAVNSWGIDWGESGLFRVRRGIDLGGIESHAYRGWLDDSVRTNAEELPQEETKEPAGTLAEPAGEAKVCEEDAEETDNESHSSEDG